MTPVGLFKAVSFEMLDCPSAGRTVFSSRPLRRIATMASSPESSELSSNVTLVFVGDSSSGKSTVIQSYLKPSSTKGAKSTFALDYNFTRRKNDGSSSSNASSGESSTTAHFWELGGDIYEPELLKIPLVTKNIFNSNVIVCLDMSKPKNALPSLLHWVGVLREVVKSRINQLKANNNNLEIYNKLKENPLLMYSNNSSKDINRVSPMQIPFYIVLTKFETMKTLTAGERRFIFLFIRFIAHYYGGSIMTFSTGDTNLKDAVRSNLNFACFGVGSLKNNLASLTEEPGGKSDKPLFIVAGSDDFDTMFQSAHGSGYDSNPITYISNTSVSKDCFKKITEQSAAIFGESDASCRSKDQINGEGGNTSSDSIALFPESDVDAARAERDACLQRYLSEVERKEFAQKKMGEAEGGHEAEEKGKEQLGRKARK